MPNYFLQNVETNRLIIKSGNAVHDPNANEGDKFNSDSDSIIEIDSDQARRRRSGVLRKRQQIDHTQSRKEKQQFRIAKNLKSHLAKHGPEELFHTGEKSFTSKICRKAFQSQVI